MSPRLASSRAAAIRWQGSKPSSLPSMASWRKLMMVRPLSVTSRTISARVGGWSSVLVWDSVSNMCSNLRRVGGWGQWGDVGGFVRFHAPPLGSGSGSGMTGVGARGCWFGMAVGWQPRHSPGYRLGVRYDGGGKSGVLVGDGGCGGSRARPLGTGLCRHDGGGESGVLVGDGGCGGSRVCPLGTGLRRHDGGGKSGVLVGDGGCGGSRARPLGTGLRRHDGGGKSGVLVGDGGCGGSRARPLGTGLCRHDGGGESGVLVGDGGCGGSRACPLGTGLRRHDGGGKSGVLVGDGGCGGSRAIPLGTG